MSRSRVLLRAALLVAGGAFMLWKALDAARGARGLTGGDATLLQRIALIEALVGLLALGAAGFALAALRPRRRKHSLHLPGSARPPPAAGAAPRDGARRAGRADQ